MRLRRLAQGIGLVDLDLDAVAHARLAGAGLADFHVFPLQDFRSGGLVETNGMRHGISLSATRYRPQLCRHLRAIRALSSPATERARHRGGGRGRGGRARRPRPTLNTHAAKRADSWPWPRTFFDAVLSGAACGPSAALYPCLRLVGLKCPP